MKAIDVYTVSHTDNTNYINTINIPSYKQLKRTKDYLREYVRIQKDHDKGRLRYYVFHNPNQWVITEADIGYHV